MLAANLFELRRLRIVALASVMAAWPPAGAHAQTIAAEPAARAKAALEQACGRCHQPGVMRTTGSACQPGDLTDLDAVGRTPCLVTPGFADGSPLYTSMLTQALKTDPFHDHEAKDRPTAEQLEAIRDWIEGLAGGARNLSRTSTPEPSKARDASDDQRDPRPAPDFSLHADQPVYKSGDPITFHVRTAGDCHLTVISVNPRGVATVLFPNEFEPRNQLVASQELQLPSATAPYVLRARWPGRETLVGICSTSATPPVGIRHDYERQRFTVLGDWRRHLAKAVALAGDDKQAGQKTRTGRVRGRRKDNGARGTDAEGPEPAATEVRKAIAVEVR